MKIVPAPRLSNIPEDGTKRAKFTRKLHACFRKRKTKKAIRELIHGAVQDREKLTKE